MGRVRVNAVYADLPDINRQHALTMLHDSIFFLSDVL